MIRLSLGCTLVLFERSGALIQSSTTVWVPHFSRTKANMVVMDIKLTPKNNAVYELLMFAFLYQYYFLIFIDIDCD